MNLKHFLLRLPINKVSKFSSRRTPTPIPSWNYREISTICSISPLLSLPDSSKSESRFGQIAHSLPYRFIHSAQETVWSDANDPETVSTETENDEDPAMNEFLSRFVWIMRGKLTAVYTDADKKDVDAMLQIIVGKVISEMENGQFKHFLESAAASASASEELSEDLWKTVWEVSNVVLQDMEKAEKKELMKSFLQCEEVKDMTRFAGEIGIRGDLLRELRFKWAREKLEESVFYNKLEQMKQEIMEPESSDHSEVKTQVLEASGNNLLHLPKRSGKAKKYQIYGLDLSKPKWAEVAEKIHETGGSIWPQEPKPISGKCKIVTEKILSLKVDDEPSTLIKEWIELLQPTRVDWIALLARLKEKNNQLFLKVAELVLEEESFEPNIQDYSQLVDSYAKQNKLEDAERITNKMNEKGIESDILTKTNMVHMYSTVGNLDLAKTAFDSLKKHGIQPDLKVYKSLIMGYINAKELKHAEALIQDIDSRNRKPSEDIYLALLKAYAQNADPTGASRIWTRMELNGYRPSLESLSYLVEAYSRKGSGDLARKHFDEIIELGYKPDDLCISRLIAAYSSKNLFDKGLQLLLKLEKQGIQYGVETYSVLVEWFGKLGLVDEVEGILGKFAEKGILPPIGVYVSLCDMYAMVQDEKKTLQSLGVLEGKKDILTSAEFERVINGLMGGGFREEAKRLHDIMKARGFTTSEKLNMRLQAFQTFNRHKPFLK